MIVQTPFSNLVLNWFHIYGRKNLPWQINRNIYFIWISEIMLQQTQVKTVIPFFNLFIKRFPTIQILAQSNLDEILYIWSGLGYYNRAYNIYKTIQIIKKHYKYHFPDNYYKLIQLPGIGKTTAGAILSFSKGYYFSILDGNVKRVLIRFYDIKKKYSIYYLNKYLWNIIQLITPIYHTDKFNQAIIDIGALICTPKKPKCYKCPLKKLCVSNKINNQFTIHHSITNLKKIVKTYWFVLVLYKNNVFLEKIIYKNIWKDLFSFPIFKNYSALFKWIQSKYLTHKISMLDIKKKQYNISNFTLYIKLYLCKINSNEKIMFETNHQKIWFNLFNPITPKIGLPSLIKNIINTIKNDICTHRKK